MDDVVNMEHFEVLIKRDRKVQKIKEYGGDYKCPECGCVVHQFDKFCHYCGQHFYVKEITYDY